MCTSDSLQNRPSVTAGEFGVRSSTFAGAQQHHHRSPVMLRHAHCLFSSPISSPMMACTKDQPLPISQMASDFLHIPHCFSALTSNDHDTLEVFFSIFFLVERCWSIPPFSLFVALRIDAHPRQACCLMISLHRRGCGTVQYDRTIHAIS